MNKNVYKIIAVIITIIGLAVLGYTFSKLYLAVNNPHGATSVGNDIIIGIYCISSICTIVALTVLCLSMSLPKSQKIIAIFAFITNLCALGLWIICHLSQYIMTYGDLMKKIKGIEQGQLCGPRSAAEYFSR